MLAGQYKTKKEATSLGSINIHIIASIFQVNIRTELWNNDNCREKLPTNTYAGLTTARNMWVTQLTCFTGYEFVFCYPPINTCMFPLSQSCGSVYTSHASRVTTTTPSHTHSRQKGPDHSNEPLVLLCC